MNKLKNADQAAIYLFFWLAVQLIFSFFLPKWSSFSTIFACALPIFCLARTGALGARDTNARRYFGLDYLWFTLFLISGCILLSFFSTFAYISIGGRVTSTQTPFFYGLVFSCLVPAFFEEWFFRGHILRLCSVFGGTGVLLSGLLFGFSHLSVVRLPYTIFAGILFSALLYFSRNIYLCMVIHAVSNTTSLCLMRLQGGFSVTAALLAVAVFFALSLALFWQCQLGEDMRALFLGMERGEFYDALSPLLILFFFIAITVSVYNMF